MIWPEVENHVVQVLGVVMDMFVRQHKRNTVDRTPSRWNESTLVRSFKVGGGMAREIKDVKGIFITYNLDTKSM